MTEPIQSVSQAQSSPQAQPASQTQSTPQAQQTSQTQSASQLGLTQIPEEVALEIRRLAHSLSNALEIVTQTSYLLSSVELKPPASDWIQMLEGGVKRALDVNLELRSYIKAHTPR